jgi:hypothetical protein
VSPVNFGVLFSGGAAFFLFVLLLVVTISVVSGSGTGESGQGLVVPAVFVLLLMSFSWRLNRMGLWMSKRGVRHRSVVWTTTIPWAEVVRFEVRKDPAPMGWLNTRTIWIVRKNGSAVATTITYGARVLGSSNALTRARDGFLAVNEAMTNLPQQTEVFTILRKLNEAQRRYA